ncbi:hypothetical protein [Neobacillus drentensis]
MTLVLYFPAIFDKVSPFSTLYVSAKAVPAYTVESRAAVDKARTIVFFI